jgi:hypothetical protein
MFQDKKKIISIIPFSKNQENNLLFEYTHSRDLSCYPYFYFKNKYNDHYLINTFDQNKNDISSLIILNLTFYSLYEALKILILKHNVKIILCIFEIDSINTLHKNFFLNLLKIEYLLSWYNFDLKTSYLSFNKPHDNFFENRHSRLSPRRSFCCIIASNYKDTFETIYYKRKNISLFFSKNLKHFDIFGSNWEGFFSNVKEVNNKFTILQKYYFSVVIENTIKNNYISEKIYDCFIAGTIPIYHGAPNINDHIPQNTFIDITKFKNYKKLSIFLNNLTAKEISEYQMNIKNFLSSDDYKKLSSKNFSKIVINCCKRENIKNRIEKIISLMLIFTLGFFYNIYLKVSKVFL